jgi:hypothetical protein
MLGLDPLGGQHGLGKILEILGDNHVAAARDGGSKNVAIVGIWERQGRDQRFVAGDKGVTRMKVHQVPCPLKGCPLAVRLLAKERLDPLAVDVAASASFEQVGDGQLQH